MAKRYTQAVEAKDAHVRSLLIIVAIMAVLNLFMWMGWRSAPKQLTVHIPQDLRQSAVQSVDEIPTANVYSFASYMFQQLQFWGEDGSTDYPANIFALQHFLTPSYRVWLEDDFETRTKKGETRDRRRTVSMVPGVGFEPRRVQVTSDGSWVVWLDMETAEYQNGLEVKRAQIRWPLRVVRYDVNRELNPWGLALDGIEPGQFPERLDQLAENQQ